MHVYCSSLISTTTIDKYISILKLEHLGLSMIWKINQGIIVIIPQHIYLSHDDEALIGYI